MLAATTSSWTTVGDRDPGRPQQTDQRIGERRLTGGPGVPRTGSGARRVSASAGGGDDVPRRRPVRRPLRVGPRRGHGQPSWSRWAVSCSPITAGRVPAAAVGTPPGQRVEPSGPGCRCGQTTDAVSVPVRPWAYSRASRARSSVRRARLGRAGRRPRRRTLRVVGRRRGRYGRRRRLDRSSRSGPRRGRRGRVRQGHSSTPAHPAPPRPRDADSRPPRAAGRWRRATTDAGAGAASAGWPAAAGIRSAGVRPRAPEPPREPAPAAISSAHCRRTGRRPGWRAERAPRPRSGGCGDRRRGSSRRSRSISRGVCSNSRKRRVSSTPTATCRPPASPGPRSGAPARRRSAYRGCAPGRRRGRCHRRWPRCRSRTPWRRTG